MGTEAHFRPLILLEFLRRFAIPFRMTAPRRLEPSRLNSYTFVGVITRGVLGWQRQKEAAWRAELNRIGEAKHHDALNSSSDTDELNRQASFRWLGDDAEAQGLRDEQTHHYVRWASFAAVAAVIVGLIGVGLTFLH
jgi:hypothetical protein